MGAANDLQAAIFTRGFIERDHYAGHVGKHAAIVIPVAIVLMPFPCTALERFFRSQFGVVVVDLAAEHVFHGVDYAVGARREAIDAIAGMIPGCHAGRFAAGIVAVVQTGLQLRIGFDRAAQQRDFFGIEQRRDENIAVAFISGALCSV